MPALPPYLRRALARCPLTPLRRSIALMALPLIALALCALAPSCSISYGFTGSSINYDLLHTIQIDKIANRAAYGWAPMEAMMNNRLQDVYTNQTRLRLVKRGGDLHIAGEITHYEQHNKGVAADGYSSQVELKLTVNIRFRNAKTGQQWERAFTAQAPYDAKLQLAAVQERLVTELIRDLSDQIFNATVADW